MDLPIQLAGGHRKRLNVEEGIDFSFSSYKVAIDRR